jgi:ElaB/YqjD/DUF883 family membrane-anchored ribosome-binding protein
MVDEMRKNLEKSKLSKEEQDRIRESVESAMGDARKAMEEARKAMEDAVKDVKRFRKNEDKKDDAPPKKPGEPL